MIRDGFKTSKGDYENTYVLYRTLDESILECKEKQDPMSIEISHISKKIQNRGIVSEVKHCRIQQKENTLPSIIVIFIINQKKILKNL